MACLLFLVTSVICAAIWVATKYWLRQTKLPPGTKLPPMPPVRSIFGHVEFKKKDFYCNQALEWAKEYGPVYRLRVNMKNVVLLNDMESMKKFCSGNKLLWRPDTMNVGGKYYTGITTMNGEVWAENRRFCMASLRDIGFGKCVIESRMLHEIQHLADRIGEANGAPLALRNDILYCVANIVASFFFGASDAHGTAASKELEALLKKTTTVVRSAALFEVWPSFIRKLLLHTPSTESYRRNAVMDEIDDFIEKQIKNYVKTPDAAADRDFIRNYLKKVEECKMDPEPKYQYRYLVGNINSFISGGVFGPTSAGHLLLVNFAARENDIQSRVHREIDEVIGSLRAPSWEDRKKMPFTMACVWEIERWRMRSPFGMPKANFDDTVVDNFFIPKDTVVLLNLYAVNNDPTYWKNPQRFDPTRYLNKDGSLVSRRPDHLVAFSVGKRMCPAEQFSYMEAFLMATLLLQKYRVVLDQPKNLDLEDHVIRRGRIDHVKLRFIPRAIKQA